VPADTARNATAPGEASDPRNDRIAMKVSAAYQKGRKRGQERQRRA
jgi:hypothetical protein